MITTGVRHFTRVADLSRNELAELLDLAAELKSEDRPYDVLHGRTIACIFEQPSTRTRMSFETAAARLGATPVELELGGRETLADTARSLSGYCAAIVVRATAPETVGELAQWATVPVINANHPSQALADLLTIREAFGFLAHHRLAFVGDGSGDAARALLDAAALTGLDLTIVCPPEHEPDPDVLDEARELARATGALIGVSHEPVTGVHGADAVYAAPHARDDDALNRFRVDSRLMSLARPGAIFLHCLPATRGDEVTADVIDGSQSLVWQQSANRLPTEEALLATLVRRG
jgi:ornithine carbamoyltransferase